MNRHKYNYISLLLIIFFSFLIFSGFSQQAKFDSLKKQLIKTTAPQKRAVLLLDIARSIYINIPDSSIGYCNQAKEISKANNIEIELAQSLLCETRYVLLKGDIKTSIEKLNQAISLFQKNGNQKDLANSYSLKSNALGRMGKDKEELEYLLKAKEIHTSISNISGLASSLQDLSYVYCTQGAHQQALNSLKELEKLNLPESSNNFFTEINYGSIYFELKNIPEAILHFKKAIDIAHHYKMLDSEITGLTHLAESYVHINDFKNAHVNYSQALLLATSNNLLVEEKEALKSLVNLFETEKNYTDAYYALKRYKIINDSLFNVEKINSINDIEHKLQLTEKEKIIVQQNLSLEKEKVALASSKNNTLLLIAGLVIVGIAFLFLFYYSRKTKKLFSLIKKQKKEVELQKEIIETKNKDVMDSIHYAKYIQGSMLPSIKTMNHLFPENFVLYKPKDVVAGDFYWTEVIDNKPVLAVCDCTGHGVPGAMVSIVACNALNRAIKEFNMSNPALIFDKVNELMQETFSKSDYEVNDGMDGVLCVFDYENKKLHVAAANNPVWIVSPPNISTNLWEESWQLSQVPPDKRPVGKFKEDASPFSLKTINVEKGEMVYLFSDGYADQFGGPKGKKFKYKQLQDLLSSIAKLPLSEQHSLLNKTLSNWQNNLDQVDDILIIGIRI